MAVGAVGVCNLVFPMCLCWIGGHVQMIMCYYVGDVWATIWAMWAAMQVCVGHYVGNVWAIMWVCATMWVSPMQVYYLSRGRLKPANRQFNNTNNDYELSLNEDTEVELVSEVWGRMGLPCVHSTLSLAVHRCCQ